MEDLGGVSISLRGSPVITREVEEGSGTTAQPPTLCSPSLTSRRAFEPGAAGLPGAVRTGCCAGQGASGCFRERNSPPELGPSPAPAATCGSVADTRARPAPPSAAAARQPASSAPGAWPGESPPPRRPGRRGGLRVRAASHWAIQAARSTSPACRLSAGAAPFFNLPAPLPAFICII